MPAKDHLASRGSWVYSPWSVNLALFCSALGRRHEASLDSLTLATVTPSGILPFFPSFSLSPQHSLTYVLMEPEPLTHISCVCHDHTCPPLFPPEGDFLTLSNSPTSSTLWNYPLHLLSIVHVCVCVCVFYLKDKILFQEAKHTCATHS